MTFRLATALLALAAAPLSAASNPIDIFVGKSHGTGLLKVLFKSPLRVDVDNDGRKTATGELILVQKIDDHRAPPRMRTWRIREVAKGHYSGTMDDSTAPVDIVMQGQTAHLTYTDHDGNHFDQLLSPAGPREVVNRMRVRRFGVVVARMTETIRKLD